MRMWMVPVECMCQKHLLGEHVETHMFLGTLRKKVSVQGYLTGGLLEVDQLFSRHEALANELERRGYKHNSPMSAKDVEDALATYPTDFLHPKGLIDVEANLVDLCTRCTSCAINMVMQGIETKPNVIALVGVAVQDPLSGAVFSRAAPARHHHLFAHIKSRRGTSFAQGFLGMTKSGSTHFLNRREALEIALRHDLIVRRGPGFEAIPGGELFSENLW